MKKALAALLLFVGMFSAFANDGVYLTHGGVIYPTKEARISLDREVLSFTVRNSVAHVDIQFVFNNLDKVERKLLVGFQAPTAVGDVSDQVCSTNLITDFRIQSGGKLLPYQLKAAESENGKLMDPKDAHFTESEQGVFVYLFEVTFKSGLNVVNHSYSFPASKNVEVNQIYNYILTTGAKWSGGVIKDFTLQVDMGDNKYFYVNDIFGKNAAWSVVGTGKVTDKTLNYLSLDPCRMVRVLSGKLQVNVKNLKPTKNVGLGVINDDSFITHITDREKVESRKALCLGDLSLDESYTKDELKLLRNTVYAQHGYAFKDKGLHDYFMQFEWYMPDPNLTIEQIALTDKEQKLVDEILKREKE